MSRAITQADPTLLDPNEVYEFSFVKSNFGHLATWDTIVKGVEYIHREPTQMGYCDTVYLLLNSRGRGVHVRMPLDVARLRLPQKLIQYYEEQSLNAIVHHTSDSKRNNVKAKRVIQYEANFRKGD
ncbi:hypothetical protein PM082_013318 [Marasmius tenuissimus]|nr:hypothetical protein PM082_013318 [Marasmius tenuissimus]